MKKKIINGILMVAMLFAATTSFVSCKDNVDDELIPVYAELAKVRSNLESRITAIESEITKISQLEQKNNEQDAAIAALQSELAALTTELNTVNEKITTLSGDVEQVRNDLASLDTRVTDLEQTVAKLIAALGELDNLILDFQVENTLNDVLGTINVPGFNLKSLAAFYGENLSGIESFPFAGDDYNVGGDYFDVLTAADIKDASLWHFFEEYYITGKSGNAGKVFFTVETPDPTNFDISEYTLSVENSVGYTFPIEFSDVKKSAYQAQWGIFKSGNVNTEAEDAPADGTYYQATAQIEPQNIEAAKFDLKKFINYKNLESDFEQIVQNIKDAKASGKTAVVKQVATEAANLVVKTFSGNMSGNNQDTKNPTWSAQRLVLSKTNADGSVTKRRTALDLALTSAAPLSYNTFWAFESKVSGIRGIGTVERAVARLANALKARIPNINTSSVNISKIEYPDAPNTETREVIVYDLSKEYATWVEANAALESSDYITYGGRWVDDYDEDGNWTGDHYAYFLGKWQEVTVTPFIRLYGFTSDLDEDQAYWHWTITNDGTLYYEVNNEWFTYNEAIAKPIIDAINDGLDLSSLQEMLNEVSSITTTISTSVDNVVDRFNSYLEKAANKYVTALNNHAITRAVAPIILYNSTEGIKRLVTGKTLTAGYLQINMTSPTEELIVPAYAKYIAVMKDGKIKENHTYAGRTQIVDLDLREAGDYTIILSCVDYYGYVITKKYQVKVVE